MLVAQHSQGRQSRHQALSSGVQRAGAEAPMGRCSCILHPRAEFFHSGRFKKATVQRGMLLSLTGLK